MRPVHQRSSHPRGPPASRRPRDPRKSWTRRWHRRPASRSGRGSRSLETASLYSSYSVRGMILKLLPVCVTYALRAWRGGSDGLKRTQRGLSNAPGWQSPAERVRLQSGSSPVQIRPLALLAELSTVRGIQTDSSRRSVRQYQTLNRKCPQKSENSDTENARKS